MAKIQLTKRTYLGEGYLHCFKHNETGELYVEECTREEYERMGRKGGAQFFPVKEGHKWVGSKGGTVKVDNLNTILGENEYCELPSGKVAVNLGKGEMYFDKAEIVDDKIDPIIFKQTEKWR